MTDHQIAKPRLFISHATSDGEFADAVKSEIEKVFANGVDVFCTSSPGAIAPGADWLSEIESRLKDAQAVIAIVTPVSIERPWLWFEVGASWGRGRDGEVSIYPLCAPEVDLSSLPAPLDRLQALSMGRAQDLKMLFQALIQQFGFGKISTFRSSNITRRIPKYKDVEITKVDLGERVLYSGRYTGYTVEELCEVIDDGFFRPDKELYDIAGFMDSGPEKWLHNGRLVHYAAVDRQLDLPPGTAKRLLALVATRYGLEPVLQTDNLARFGQVKR